MIMEGLEKLREGLCFLDTYQFGIPRYGGVYILYEGGEVALIEAGTSLATPRVLGTLGNLGIKRATVRYLFLTHIHLDHAGGAGTLVHELPEVQVVVHERGVKHLIDPTNLLASVREAVGKKFPLYGTAVPISPDRLIPVTGVESFRVGKLEVKVIPSPGHAPHHVCYFLPQKGEIFTGDAAGLYFKGQLYPTTPPPSFDLERSLETLDRLAALRPEVLLYTHYGPGKDPARLLKEYKEFLCWWVKKIEAARVSFGDEWRALERLFSDPEVERFSYRSDHEKGELSMNIRGVLRYLSRRAA